MRAYSHCVFAVCVAAWGAAWRGEPTIEESAALGASGAVLALLRIEREATDAGHMTAFTGAGTAGAAGNEAPTRRVLKAQATRTPPG